MFLSLGITLIALGSLLMGYGLGVREKQSTQEEDDFNPFNPKHDLNCLPEGSKLREAILDKVND